MMNLLCILVMRRKLTNTVVSRKRTLFTVSEEIDPTEEGLESLEWDNNEKNGNKSVPLHQKSHCQTADLSHLHNDFPSFYL